MDVNNTRFHLLLGRRDWTQHLPDAASPPEGTAAWDPVRHSLTLPPRVLRLPLPNAAERLTQADRRGSGRDRYGNWYAINAARTGITFLPAGQRVAEAFWPRPDVEIVPPPEKASGGFVPDAPPPVPPALPLHGLAVTTHHYLVVGVLGDAPGLLIFDLHAGGPPRRLHWPLPFRPVDMAPRPGGGVWVLDVPESATPRVWALDRYFRVECRDQEVDILAPGTTDLFAPEGEMPREHPARRFPVGLALSMASPLESSHPVAIEALPDDTLLVLDVDPTGASTLVRYDFGRQRGPEVVLDDLLAGRLVMEEDAPPYAFVAYDLAFVPDAQQLPPHVTGSLYLVDTGGQQAFGFHLDADDDRLDLHLLNTLFPLRRFDGKALVAAGGDAYYDLADRWLPVTGLPRPRYETEAVFEIDPDLAFDGKTPDCVWHRLFLDACIPPGTRVAVQSRAANTRELLKNTRWETEPALYLRSTGAEIPYYRPFSKEETSREGTGTWELLVQRAKGRYLQLRLVLTGNGRRSPRLHALRLYYGRFSYLNEYLPAVYRQDETSASFLDRFLANVEGTFTSIEGRIAEAQALFDTRIVDDEYLGWLAFWLGAVLDPAYDERRRRLFIDHAIALYNQRGTPAGIARAIRLVIDPCPDASLFEPGGVACDIGAVQACGTGTQVFRQEVRLIEHFLLRKVPGVVYGDPTDLSGPVYATSDEAWTPKQGAEPLHKRYRTFLQERYPTIQTLSAAWGKTYASFGAVTLSPVPPQQATHGADWQAFIQTRLGFTYAEASGDDVDLYRAFLRRRYRRVDDLKAAHQKSYAGFSQVALPAENDFPTSGARLYDWIQFVSLLLPIERNAHRFTVLVPTRPGSDLAEQAELMALVERVVEAEKPAHTAFEVKPYWALFRVGTARLGLDTLLDVGSRYVALLLGHGRLAEGYLAAAHPWDIADRLVAGRDRMGTAPPL